MYDRRLLQLLPSMTIALIAARTLAGEGTIVHQVSLSTLSGGLGQYLMQGASPPPQTDAFPIAAAVPKFPDCPQRVLTSVRVRLVSTTSSQFQASSQPGSITVVTGALSVQTTLAGAGFTNGAGGPTQQAGPVTLSAANNYQAYPGLSPTTSTATNDVVVPASANASYVGAGNATFGGQILYGQTGSASPYPVNIQFFRTTTRVLTVTYAFTTPPVDVNGDQNVDGADLSAVLGAWGSLKPGAADVDADGDVDAEDLASVLAAWGPIGCP